MRSQEDGVEREKEAGEEAREGKLVLTLKHQYRAAPILTSAVFFGNRRARRGRNSLVPFKL